jgi:DNA-binding NarL/FixJ family response regulator
MIKILIVDDQSFTRQALQAILESETDFDITGKANNGIQAFELIKQMIPDIILVDLEMPEMNGLVLTQKVRQNFPQIKVIILSANDDEKNINAAVESGARGYLLKSTSAQEIIDTIRAVQRGYFQLGPGLFEKLLSHLINEKANTSENLSQMEIKYSKHLKNLEQKLAQKNARDRQELFEEIHLQINNLKVEFREGLETFQHQVTNQLQQGIDASKSRFQNSLPDLKTIERQIDSRNLEHQRYINTLFATSKQSIRKLE